METGKDANLSLSEVAAELSTRDHNVKIRHVRKMLGRGELKGFKVARVWRVKKSELDKFMDGEKGGKK